MNWQLDPAYLELKKEFIQSFPQRLQRLRSLITRLTSMKEEPSSILSDCQILSHSLAGAAGTYGFPVLTDIFGKLDDFISLESKEKVEKEALRFMQFVEEALNQTVQSGVDPSGFEQDSRYLDLTSDVQSLLD